jgi:signal transduction histidine kinase
LRSFRIRSDARAVIPSIRWRVGLSVFLVVACFQVIVSIYALSRVQASQLQSIDDDLGEELAEIAPLIARGADVEALRAYVHTETENNTKWDEDFFEIRDPAGRRVVASPGVPPQGLHLSSDAQPLRTRGETIQLAGAQVDELRHPASRSGHTRIRVARAEIRGHQLTVAESLKASQKALWSLREQLAWGLLVVSLIGALVGWWVARRSLEPIQLIADHARRLGASPEGTLPRTGSGDELDRLAAVLNEMLERIRAEVQRVRRVTADAAHTLRTPLTTIRGIIELQLRSGKPQADDLVPALEVLDESVGLLNRMLQLERLESGEATFALVELRLDQLARDVCEAVAIAAEERCVELVFSGVPVTVRGDEYQLRNAILNLLDNALRHTPRGGRIDVSVQLAGAGARLSVEDSGPGLPSEKLERVFERFYSEREDGAVGGLGLPIARAIARTHGGTLTASSPRGARFDLELPQA